MRTLVALLLLAGAAQAGDYRLQPGDVVGLSIISPPVREELPVDLDGNVALPFAGPVPARGRTLAELTADARARLAAIDLPPAGGEVLPGRIWPGAVTLSLRQYRPVYVAGDVRSPGGLPFIPGLTARRALALAGGALRLPDASLRRLEIEGSLAELEASRATAAARLARLRQEVDPAAGTSLPADEGAILDQRRAQDAAAAAHFNTAIRHTRAQIDDLTAQLATETEGMSADRADFDHIAELREAGTATTLRLTDARRALLFSTTRQLQTATELARTTRELGSVEYEELRRTLDLGLETLTETADAAGILAELDARIAAARRQLAWLDASDAPASVTVTAAEGAPETLAPNADRPLAPGDLVTLTLGGTPATE